MDSIVSILHTVYAAVCRPNKMSYWLGLRNRHANAAKRNDSVRIVPANKRSIWFSYKLRRWCNGIMQDSHSCDPGSIPGRRIGFACFLAQHGAKRHSVTTH